MGSLATGTLQVPRGREKLSNAASFVSGEITDIPANCAEEKLEKRALDSRELYSLSRAPAS